MPVESIVRIQSIRKVQLVHTKSIRIQNYYSVEFSLNLPTGIDPKVKIKHVEMKFCCNVRFTISDPIRFIFIPAMTLNVIQVHTYALHADQCNLRKKFIFLPFFWVSSMRSFTCLSIRKMKIALSNSTMWNGIQLSFYLPHKINGMYFPLIVCNSTITKQATTRNIRAFPMIFVKHLSLETLLKIVFLE